MLGARRRSFTLIDLVMVVVVITIVAAVAAPRYANALVRYRAEAAARRIVVDTRLAQQTAKTTSSSRTIIFDTTNHAYSISDVRALDGQCMTYVVTLREPPYLSQIASVDMDGDAQLTFDGYGIPDSGGFVIVQAGDYQYTVVVDPETGAAEVQ